ncbi:VC0807 family protein [Nonomuraea soli]|uniref:DUF3159 domain-containing protein n=1 Tax=Nonomuraea soli TaxID=1032476 RepID=A0A7W0CIY0_9ACTN|nr:VC0807 family protein [Nonomuraea soli]MBA2891914.1 hypothetical protein [Nonomuraea soli]
MSVLEAPPVAASFTMPSLPTLLRHALPRAIESMFMPVIAFWAGFFLAGLAGGLVTGLMWVYGCAAWRLARRTALPGMVILAVVAITARTAFSLAADSAVLYFLPPLAGVFCVSLVFLATAPTRRPLARRVACDLVPMPEGVQEHPAMRRFFRRHSVMWGCVQLANASLSLWLLLSQPVEGFLLVRTCAVAVLLSCAGLVSLLGFRRALRALQLRP